MGYYDENDVWREGNPPPAQGGYNFSGGPRGGRRARTIRPAEERQADANPGVRRQARRQMRQGYYDDNDNWVAPAPANFEETVADLGPSVVAGLQRFVAGTAGTGRDLADLSDAAVRFGAQVGGADEQTAERIAGALSGVRDTAIMALNPSAGVPVVTALRGPGSAEINRAAFPDQHVPQTTVGEYARTIGEFAPNALAPVRGAGNILARVAPLTRTSRAVVPAVASEAAGQLTEGTSAEGPARILAALVAGGVSEVTIQVLTRQGLTPDQRALRLISRELADAGYSPDEITRVANRLLQQAPTEEVLGELMGPSGQRLMRATAAMGRGAGRSTATNTLDTRAVGRPGPATSQDPNRRGVPSTRERVIGETVRTFAPQQNRAPREYWDSLMTLRRARRAQAANNYRAAYAYKMDTADISDYVLPALRNASPEAMSSGSVQLASVERRIQAQIARLQREATTAARRGGAPTPEAQQRLQALQAELADVGVARRQLEGFANGAPPNTVNARALDFYNRGLRQLERASGPGSPEGASFGEEAREFRNLVQEVNPALADAVSTFASSKRIQEFMRQGQRIFDMSDGELDRVLQGDLMAGEADNIVGNRALTTEEFDAFQLGVLDAFERKLGTNDTGFLARLARNQNWRNALTRATMPPTNPNMNPQQLARAQRVGAARARRFMNRLAREASMQQTRNFVQSGSRTQPLQEDIRALTEGENELAYMNDNVTGLINAAGRRAANPWEWGMRVATWLYDRFKRPGIANPQVQEAMARRLFTRVTRESSRELRDAILALRTDQRVSPEIRQFLMAMTTGSSASQSDDEPAPASEQSAAAPSPTPQAASIERLPDGRYRGEDGSIFDTYEEAYAQMRWRTAQGAR